MTLGVKDLPAYPMRAVCNALLQETTEWTTGKAARGGSSDKPEEIGAAWHSGSSLLPGLKSAMDIYYNLTGAVPCYDPSTQPPWAAIGDLMSFIDCTTSGFGPSVPFASDGKGDMFWNEGADQERDNAACAKKWGGLPWAPHGWSQTFGGFENLEALSNMVFSQGELDVCAGGGVDRNVSDSMIAITIPMQGHHVDLMFANPLDTPGVAVARDFEIAQIRTWVKEAQEKKKLGSSKAEKVPDQLQQTAFSELV